MAKTIAVFGAGSGMGLSTARRFGTEGYRVALIARRREPLEEMAAKLAEENIETATFTADLSRTETIAPLVASIRERLGRIDTVVYSPFSPTSLVPAAELSADMLRAWIDLYLLTPVEVVRAVLPEMTQRGDGAIVFGFGYSVVAPSAGLSGPVPVLAAARNYLHTLHDEVAEHGVYAGALAVRAVIDRSESHEAIRAGDVNLAVDLPTVDPDELADLVWSLAHDRNRVELVHP